MPTRITIHSTPAAAEAARAKAKAEAEAAARRADPAWRLGERLAAFVPPPGDHPLNTQAGRAILGDLRAAGTRAEQDACLARLFAFLAAHAAPSGGQTTSQGLWIARFRDAIALGFVAPRGGPKKTRQAREDAWLVQNVLGLDGLTFPQVAGWLAQRHGIKDGAAAARLIRASAEGGFALPPGERFGRNPKKTP